MKFKFIKTQANKQMNKDQGPKIGDYYTLVDEKTKNNNNNPFDEKAIEYPEIYAEIIDIKINKINKPWVNAKKFVLNRLQSTTTANYSIWKIEAHDFEEFITMYAKADIQTTRFINSLNI
jgi:hypothetical protein